MPMIITAKDGRVLYVRTHVGDSITVVEIWEEEPAPLQPIDTSGGDDE